MSIAICGKKCYNRYNVVILNDKAPRGRVEKGENKR